MAVGEIMKKIVKGTIKPPGKEGVLLDVAGTCKAFRGVWTNDMAADYQFLVFPYTYIPSVHDLEGRHLYVVMAMVRHARTFVRMNWGAEHRAQYGFMVDSEVGYLSLHVLIGPLTVYGWSKKDEWVDASTVIDFLTHN